MAQDPFIALLAAHEPRITAAFLDAVRDLVDSITLKAVVERLERGDVSGAIQVMHLDPEAFGRLERAIADAYNDGGQATVDVLPRPPGPDGARAVYRFGMRNTLGEDWLRQHSARLVTRTTEDMKEAIRVAFTEGLAQGQNPRVTARQVIGRRNRATGAREGGVIGLTSTQERYVANARSELLSGDPQALSHYLTRGRRDKRFDPTIRKAIRESKPVPAELADNIAGRYADGLLMLRGEMIGQNETAAALNHSREEAVRQQIASGKIEAEDVQKVWKHTPQEHPRIGHVAMNGKSVAWGEKFELPNGTEMEYPHSDDAPASETIFCKCFWSVKVDFFGSVQRQFVAEMV